MINRLLAAMLALSAGTTAHAAVVFSTDTVQPTTDVMLSNTGTAAFARILAHKSTQTARQGGGQTFLVPDAGPASTQWELQKLTLQKSVTQSTVGTSSLSLWVFQFNPSTSATDGSEWVKGDGLADADPLDGTGTTNILLNKATIDITNKSFTAGDYLHFAFSSPLLLDEGKAYAFYLQFAGNQSGITMDTNSPSIPFQLASPSSSASSTPTGFMINTIDATLPENLYNANQDLTYYLTATPVPEPGMLGTCGMLAAAGLLRRRRG